MAENKIQTVTDISSTSSDEDWTPVSGTDVESTKRAMDMFTFTGFSLPKYDFFAMVIASAVETYTFRTGGSGGTIVAVVVLTYVSASRVDILNAERTT